MGFWSRRRAESVKFVFQVADVKAHYRSEVVEFPGGRCPKCRADLEEVGFVEWSLSEIGVTSGVETNRFGEKELIIDGEEVMPDSPSPEVIPTRIACGGCWKPLVEGSVSVEGFVKTSFVELGGERLRDTRASSNED